VRKHTILKTVDKNNQNELFIGKFRRIFEMGLFFHFSRRIFLEENKK